jgi:ABC-type uncharacterized transport system fused permease/ATPase subunit
VTVDTLLQRWINVAIQQARLTWIINGNSAFAPIIPLLLGAPKFLAGTLRVDAARLSLPAGAGRFELARR